MGPGRHACHWNVHALHAGDSPHAQLLATVTAAVSKFVRNRGFVSLVSSQDVACAVPTVDRSRRLQPTCPDGDLKWLAGLKHNGQHPLLMRPPSTSSHRCLPTAAPPRKQDALQWPAIAVCWPIAFVQQPPIANIPQQSTALHFLPMAAGVQM